MQRHDIDQGIKTVALTALLLGAALTGHAENSPAESAAVKSTLETFHLAPLDADNLADAVIEGGLTATAAGEETVPVTIVERSNKAEKKLLTDELVAAPQPRRPQPNLNLAPPVSKQTNYDYLNRIERF